MEASACFNGTELNRASGTDSCEHASARASRVHFCV